MLVYLLIIIGSKEDRLIQIYWHITGRLNTIILIRKSLPENRFRNF